MSFMGKSLPGSAERAAANDGGALDLECCEAKFLGTSGLNKH
jgi:hypothetical protein